MRNSGMIRALLACCVLLLFSASGWADALDTIVAQTQSSDPTVRVAAFYALGPYLAQIPLDSRISAAVTNLLVLETSFPSSVSTDNDAEYMSDLITSVVQLNNPSAIAPLVAVIGSGNMVPRRLAQYGTSALAPVVARAANQDWIVRKCVMITLSDMLSPANLPSDQASVDLIRATLAQGALDAVPYVSESAVAGLDSTVTLFSKFSSTAETSKNGFELVSKFTLGSGSKGINPTVQGVVLSLGSYSVTIPEKSFHMTSKGSYAYEGTINGVSLEARIAPITAVTNSYTLTAEGNTSVDLSHPAIVLTIGNDMGFGAVKLDN
jgi:hypothetical protein